MLLISFLHVNNLGNSLLTRFERLGELSDLEEAILRHRDTVDLTPDGHPDKLCRLNDLGNFFFTHFERLGELSDLEEAIPRYRYSADHVSHGYPDKHSYLNNVGISSEARFHRLRELRKGFRDTRMLLTSPRQACLFEQPRKLTLRAFRSLRGVE
jgi:hypothetical protein